MNTKKIGCILAVGMGVTLLAGCGSEKKNIYKQAEENLEQGNYQEALEGYEASISNGYKPTESFRGAGIARLRMGDSEGAVDAFTKALGTIRRENPCVRISFLIVPQRNFRQGLKMMPWLTVRHWHRIIP